MRQFRVTNGDAAKVLLAVILLAACSSGHGDWRAEQLRSNTTLSALTAALRIALETRDVARVSVVCEGALQELDGPRKAVAHIPDGELRGLGERRMSAYQAAFQACVKGDLTEAAFQERRATELTRLMTARLGDLSPSSTGTS